MHVPQGLWDFTHNENGAINHYTKNSSDFLVALKIA